MTWVVYGLKHESSAGHEGMATMLALLRKGAEGGAPHRWGGRGKADSGEQDLGTDDCLNGTEA